MAIQIVNINKYTTAAQWFWHPWTTKFTGYLFTYEFHRTIDLSAVLHTSTDILVHIHGSSSTNLRGVFTLFSIGDRVVLFSILQYFKQQIPTCVVFTIPQ